MNTLTNPIIEKSFALIDEKIGKHNLSLKEYNIVRRIIHTTADFEYLDLVTFTPNFITSAILALQNQTPIITDVSMIKEGIKNVVQKTFQNDIIVAVQQAKTAAPGKTLTETGLLNCCHQYPQGIYVIGNAPTALLALVEKIQQGIIKPACVIGVPVGFVSVLEAKQSLANTHIPQIQVKGNKGGSTVACAIVNALCIMAYN